MALNAYYGSKKVLVLGLDNSGLASKIVKAMRAINMSGATAKQAPANYSGYYLISEMQPDYTIFVQRSEGCRVQPCRVDGWPKERLGVYASRKIDKSQKAKHLYKHPLKMLGLDPCFNGNYKIDFDEVSDLPWFWQDDGPMIYLRVPDVEGIGEAVAEAVADYFKPQD